MTETLPPLPWNVDRQRQAFALLRHNADECELGQPRPTRHDLALGLDCAEFLAAQLADLPFFPQDFTHYLEALAAQYQRYLDSTRSRT